MNMWPDVEENDWVNKCVCVSMEGRRVKGKLGKLFSEIISKLRTVAEIRDYVNK